MRREELIKCKEISFKCDTTNQTETGENKLNLEYIKQNSSKLMEESKRTEIQVKIQKREELI